MDTFFYKGKENIFEKAQSQTQNKEDNNTSKKKMQEEFLKVLDNKNLSFLLGSGCSSFEIDKKKENSEETETVQVGIPVMCPLAEEFYKLDTFATYRRWLKLFVTTQVSQHE